ncbi:MAG: glycosyltransferase, partial [Bdellovibrionales bacterium]|nr:glycosyltransferase [Bdellovibrionales bacterium]
MHTRAVLAPCYKKQIYDRWISTREERSALEGNVDSSILISLVMPVFNTAPWLLDLAVQSVIDQTYENWELCIVDDGSLRPSTIECLAKYQAADSRIRVTRSEQNLDISAASNCALAMCKGDFVGLIDHDDILAPHALTRVAGCLGANKNLKLVFSDEDRITMSGERLEPYFKPGWNRLLLLEQNLVSHFGVYDRELLISIGGFREGLEGSQDWDLALRAAHKLRDSQIQHIPEVLYHWRIEPRSVSTSSVTQSRAVSAGIRA